MKSDSTLLPIYWEKEQLSTMLAHSLSRTALKKIRFSFCTSCQRVALTARVSVLHLQQVQQFSVALLQHCLTLFSCPPHLPHHQLPVARGAVDVLVLDSRGEGPTGQLSESLQASCSSTGWEVRGKLDDRYPLLLLF